VTNVHTDAGVASIENGITGVSWREIKLFPETGMAMGDVVLAVFAQITSVGVNHGGGVVINAGHFDFVDGNDEDHLIFFRKFLHQADSGAVGDALSKFIPAGFLLGTKIRAVKKFLKAEDLYFFLSGGGNEAFVLGNHFLFYVEKRIFFRGPLTVSLNQAATNDTGHVTPPEKSREKVYLSGVYPTRRENESSGQVIFRGTRAFLPGNSMESVEKKGNKYGAEGGS